MEQKKHTLTFTEEDIDKMRKFRDEAKERWNRLGITEPVSEMIGESIKDLYEGDASRYPEVKNILKNFV